MFFCEISDFFDSTLEYGLGDFAMYSIVGLIIVIAALAVLVLLISLLAKVLDIKLPSKKTEAPAAAEVKSETADDAELVAAIMAAVSLCLEAEAGENTVPVPFVIKSIKRK